MTVKDGLSKVRNLPELTVMAIYFTKNTCPGPRRRRRARAVPGRPLLRRQFRNLRISIVRESFSRYLTDVNTYLGLRGACGVFSGARWIATLPVLFPLVSFAGGDGSLGNPFTGDDVPARMDAGTALANAYYLLDAAKSFGSLEVDVGFLGQKNHLTILSGALVTSGAGEVGYGDETLADPLAGGHNSVLVAGTGSSWTMSGSLAIGDWGSHNSMTVSGGAAVTNTNCWIGAGDDTSADFGNDNTMIVSGAGTRWTCGPGLSGGGLYIGSMGSRNLLMVSNGAAVTCKMGYIGAGSSANAALGCDNVAVVESGASLTSANSIYVGRYGSGCALDVTGEGSKVSCRYAFVGYGNSGSPLLGTSSSLSVSSGALLTVTEECYVDMATHPADSSERSSLSISSGGAARCGSLYVGYGDAADSTEARYGSLSVTGTGSTLDCTGALDVGFYGCFGSFAVSDGAAVTSASACIGTGAGDYGVVDPGTGYGNSVLFQKASWTVANELCVGRSGDGNSLILLGDGSLRSATFLLGSGYVASDGRADHGTGNKTYLSDAVLTVDGVLYAGERGYGNTMPVMHSTVTCASCEVGYGNKADGSDGFAPCTDGSPLGGNNVMALLWNSRLECAGDLCVGHYGSGNLLFLGKGGRVTLGAEGLITIGEGSATEASAGCDNRIVACGYDTLWDCGALKVGVHGGGNSLDVVNGAAVSLDAAKVSVADASAGGKANVIRLAKGFLVTTVDKDSASILDLVDAGKVQVWSATASGGTGGWVTASPADLTKTYSTDGAVLKAATALGSFAGYDIAGGFTVLTGGDQYVDTAWALPTQVSGQWYKSSWYGSFHTQWCCQKERPVESGMAESGTGWIWHGSHGWQYVYPGSTASATWLWDCATASWWYTNSTVYPAMYRLAVTGGVWGGAWYYYMGGSMPEREFWDYAADAKVPESALAE
jgi:T5SS/PEP-CTERM-associated repeat protein